MNKSLFRSPYVLIALAALAAWIVLLATGRGRAGVVGETSHGARLLTGGIALGCMLLALGYVLRKYMHKYGYSPEFKLRVEIAQMERAESRISALRREILRNQHASQSAVESIVARILREEGVHRILRAVVTPGPASGPKFVISVGKAFPFGKAAKWLHLHLYVSVAFALAVFMHGGSGWDSPMGILLLALSALVVVTGVVGIFLWAFGPAWLTNREHDLSIEESFVLREGFGRKLKELREKLDPELRAVFESAGTGPESATRTRTVLAALAKGDAARRILVQDAFVLRGQLARVEAEFRVLWRTRLAFMAWRAVHLPAALFLSLCVVAHVISIAVY